MENACGAKMKAARQQLRRLFVYLGITDSIYYVDRIYNGEIPKCLPRYSNEQRSKDLIKLHKSNWFKKMPKQYFNF